MSIHMVGLNKLRFVAYCPGCGRTFETADVSVQVGFMQTELLNEAAKSHTCPNNENASNFIIKGLRWI